MKQVVGINFSSRNRPEILEKCLTQVSKFLSIEKYDYVITVVNDLGDNEWDTEYQKLIDKFSNFIWHRSAERLGIAGTKNHGIKMLNANNCDHYFLFDDDVFPIKYGWDELYIETANSNRVHHLMHLIPLPAFKILKNEHRITEYSQCSGVMLYFTNYAISIVGGFRKTFHIYGHEHTELSLRCNFASLQPGWGPFISPEKSQEFIYSLDLNLNNLGEPPPDFEITQEMKRSSLYGEDIQSYINHNTRFLEIEEPIYEQI
jgi:GT2 family glycosyltransferase